MNIWNWIYQNWLTQETFWTAVGGLGTFFAVCLAIKRPSQKIKISLSWANKLKILSSEIIGIGGTHINFVKKNGYDLAKTLIIVLLNKKKNISHVKDVGIKFKNGYHMKFTGIAHTSFSMISSGKLDNAKLDGKSSFEIEVGDLIHIPMYSEGLLGYARSINNCAICAYVVNGYGKEYDSRKIYLEKHKDGYIKPSYTFYLQEPNKQRKDLITGRTTLMSICDTGFGLVSGLKEHLAEPTIASNKQEDVYLDVHLQKFVYSKYLHRYKKTEIHQTIPITELSNKDENWIKDLIR